MTNKISQEIEEKIMKIIRIILKEHLRKYPYSDVFYPDEIEEAIKKGFKAGQKQKEDEVLKLIDKRIRKLKRCKDVEWENRLSIEVLEELKSKLLGDKE
jgi:hypothetical protein